MGAKSIIPEILAKLEPYLDQCDLAWEAQPAEGRKPTLPLTRDNKVNVRAITKALGLRTSHEQHFFNKRELAGLINALAVVQNVKPIGARAIEEAADKVVEERIARMASNSNDLTRELSEREALIERYRRENEALREQLRLLEQTGLVLRQQEVF